VENPKQSEGRKKGKWETGLESVNEVSDKVDDKVGRRKLKE